MPSHQNLCPDYKGYRQPVVRDLAWLSCRQWDLIPAPSRYEVFAAFSPEITEQWLSQLDQTYDKKTEVNSHRRLGLYFEDLVAFYLRHHPESDVTELQRNVALREPLDCGVRTIGELDFLYRRGGHLEHLEVAVKFYLGVDVAGSRRWLGPNSKDRLDIKWQHMISHQLPLGRNSALPAQVQSRYWMKGILFEPWRPGTGTPQQVRYDWLRVGDVRVYFEEQQGLWHPLPKAAWLGAYTGSTAPLSAARVAAYLQRHFADKSSAVMLTRYGALEQRCIVVADQWPQPPITDNS